MNDCIFCKIASGKLKSEIIYENDNFICFRDSNQKVEGHSLVVPKKHFETFLDLPSTLGMELIDCMKNSILKLMNEIKAEGFNVVSNNYEIAGQVVKHLHLHILPRKKGDKVPSLY